MVTIKRISVSSAMKIGALLYAALFTVFGFFIIALEGAAFSALSNSLNGSGSSSGLSGGSFMAAGLAGFCFFYVIGVIFCAISGGIGGAVAAFLYNLIANWVGGLQVELTGKASEKPKRTVAIEEPTTTGF